MASIFPTMVDVGHCECHHSAVVKSFVIVLVGGVSLLGEAQDNICPRLAVATVVVVAWLLVPGLIAFMKSLVSTPALTNRNILPSAPQHFWRWIAVAMCFRYLPVWDLS